MKQCTVYSKLECVKWKICQMSYWYPTAIHNFLVITKAIELKSIWYSLYRDNYGIEIKTLIKENITHEIIKSIINDLLKYISKMILTIIHSSIGLAGVQWNIPVLSYLEKIFSSFSSSSLS